MSKAYLQGFRDGFANPIDLGSGLTWEPDDSGLSWSECDRLNETYDTGANHGQIIGGRRHVAGTQ